MEALKMSIKNDSPFAPIHPGEILREETLPGHNWDAKKLAEKMDVSLDKVIDLINERIPVDEDLSKRLGKAFDIDKGFWLRFQQNYEMEIIEDIIKIKMFDAGTPITLDELNKQKTILAALSATKTNAKIGSVHVQKIIFKIDREIDKSNVWIPEFGFVPYKHGPFDHEVNSILIRLADEGLVDIAYPSGSQEWRKRKYVLNSNGREIGIKMLEKMPYDSKNKVIEIVKWAMKLSMKQLKSEIYREYPEFDPEIAYSV